MLFGSFLVRRFTEPISAGFPSPAEGFEEERLDVHQFLVRNEAATFFIWFAGDELEADHILDGSLLVVDKSIRARSGRFVVIRRDGADAVVRFTEGLRGVVRGVIIAVINRY